MKRKHRRKNKFEKFLDNIMFKIQSKKLTLKQLSNFKSSFRMYFEGYSFSFSDDNEYDCEPLCPTPIPVRNFEITDFSGYIHKGQVTIVITLCRPCILIGRYGATIEGLKKHFNDCNFDVCNLPIKIDIQESRMWHSVR